MQHLRIAFGRHFNFLSCTRCYSVQKQTILNDEIKKFSEQADSWWDPVGPMQGLHTLNQIRVPFITESVLNNPSQPSSGPKCQDRNGPAPLKGYKLIDVGCGAGLLSEPLARLGADTTGLDAGKDLISVAQRHASLDPKLSENLRYANMTVEEHVIESSASYDALACSEVVEHVNNLEFFIHQCVKLVKPGGSLIFTTINRNLLSGLIVILAAEHILKVVPKGTHQYDLLVRPQELEKILKSNNCDMRKIQGLLCLPTQRWITVASPCVNYAVHAVKTAA